MEPGESIDGIAQRVGIENLLGDRESESKGIDKIGIGSTLFSMDFNECLHIRRVSIVGEMHYSLCMYLFMSY